MNFHRKGGQNSSLIRDCGNDRYLQIMNIPITVAVGSNTESHSKEWYTRGADKTLAL
jgi:hypothetical protein